MSRSRSVPVLVRAAEWAYRRGAWGRAQAWAFEAYTRAWIAPRAWGRWSRRASWLIDAARAAS